MSSRRNFLAGLTAASLCPAPSWADAGSPAFLSAALLPDGSHALIGLSAQAQITFQIPLPDRGHAAAAHPKRPEAVAFARRPGTFALVIDCTTGRPKAKLTAPPDRHFYGHGTFTADGRHMFTTENDFARARGMIGIWDTANGYTRLGEVASGGIGPHDIAMLADDRTLAIANGGIETHPDSGRAKLNIPTMRPNLTYLDTVDFTTDRVELDAGLRRNSIRHLALGKGGTVAVAMQWEGDSAATPPLVAAHRPGAQVRLLQAPMADHRQMQGYASSLAVSKDGQTIAVTSSHGGMLQLFDTGTGDYLGHRMAADISGIAAGLEGFVATTGTGTVMALDRAGIRSTARHDLAWDNHLIAIA